MRGSNLGDMNSTPRPSKISQELLTELPKTDLHLHLDGSLRPETLIELAKERKVKLPAYSRAGLYKKVFKESYEDLHDYLRGFAYTTAVMRDRESLTRVTYELCKDSQADGVRYIEIRFAPQLHTTDDFPIMEVLKAVAAGISKAEKEFNSRAAVRNGKEPPFRAGILVCAMRFFAEPFSPSYRELLTALADLPREQVFGIASETLVRTAIKARDDLGLPIVGLDLAGPEKGNPASVHKRAYEMAHEAFLGKTVHAGEDYGPESIFQAITDCRADRIGHGTWIFQGNRLSKEVQDRSDYVQKLVRYVAERRITLEVCLTSNLQTLPVLKNLKSHPFGKMLNERISVTLCTDNTLVSRTTITNEYAKAIDAFKIDASVLRHLLVYGFKRSFFPGSYTEKRAYVRQVLDYRDEVFARHGFEPHHGSQS
jgi:adenosine deaminase